MPRYKPQDRSPRFMAVDPAEQILPGSFEHALSVLIDQDISVEAFDRRFKNDEVGASAYAPAVLLKVVLLAYSKGIVRSRQIEALCRQNALFNAISGDSQPHFTTIARFVSGQHRAIVDLFARVLVICNREGLIGRQMFAVDGVKLPGNASKARSGRRADFEREAARMEAQVDKLVQRHRQADARGEAPDEAAAQREAKRMQRLQDQAQQLREWLREHPQDRKGPNGKVRQSNRTDNDSAKMATGKGVIQGYTAVAAVDEHHQIIVEAQAHGVGQEQELLLGLAEALKDSGQLSPETVLTADAGYCSERALQGLEQRAVSACIPDPNWRKRDCGACPLRAKCLRKPDKTAVRQVIIVIGRTPGKPEKAIERMKRKVDSEEGRDLIARRFAIVEPVFGNVRYNKRLDRFTVRGRSKVDGQWKLYCLVHNIEKLANNGYAG